MKKGISWLLISVLCLSIMGGCGADNTTTASVSTTEPASAETVVKDTATPEITAAEPTEKATPAPTKAPETKKKTEKKAQTPTPMPTPTPTSAPEPAVPMNPLTGQQTEKDLTGKRPFVFMCNNIAEATPHRGVSHSDMIMEMMDEGGITRMMVFITDTEGVGDVGSIRSARQYNAETTYGYDAILVRCGGSDEADAFIWSRGAMEIDQISGEYTGDAFYRDPNRMTYGAVNSLFARAEAIYDSAINYKGYSPDHYDGFDNSYGLTFSDKAESQCSLPAASINITYNGGKTSSFQYEQDSTSYYMYQYGEEYTDDYIARVPFSNVIMIYANTYLQSDGQHLTIDLTSGDGYFFTKGIGVPIKWYKDSIYNVFHYTLEDGTPLALTPGRTFVSVNQCGSYQGYIDFN